MHDLSATNAAIKKWQQASTAKPIPSDDAVAGAAQVRCWVAGLGWLSVFAPVLAYGDVSPNALSWTLRISLFLAAATWPHFAVEVFANLAIKLADLGARTHKQGFTNPSAFLGILERILFLACLVAGYPAFIGAWFLFKAASDWKGWAEDDDGRRKFGVYLMNFAVSLTGVAIAWGLWRLLGLPVVSTPP